MATPSLSGISYLGQIQSEEITINNNLFTYPIPSASTDKSVQGNILGKTRVISINGIFKGTEAQINVFIQAIEAWVNESGFGKFQSNRTYTDSFSNSYTVLGRVFDWNRRNINQNVISYELEMIEGSTINTIVIGDVS